MGQYYKPISLDKKEYVYSHAYNNGLKLMEHSYIGNSFMKVIENLLAKNGRWYKTRLVWAGDYADNEKGFDTNLYNLVMKEIRPTKKEYYRYIVNHSKKIYIDKRGIRKSVNGWKIHPLSLLTTEGNGRGGGDFYGEDDRIGTWARDVISMENSVESYKDYAEVDGTFIE